MTDFFTAIGLALAIEGVLYALFPDGMKRMVTEVLAQPATNLRAFGVAAAVFGVGVVWLARA